MKQKLTNAFSLALIMAMFLTSIGFAAELVTAELTGTANDVTVAQGSSASFTISVTATGSISCAITSDSPSTATVDTSYSISAGGAVSASGSSAAMSFFSSTPCTGTNGSVTWVGAPAPYSVSATVSANASTPVGTYFITLVESAGTTQTVDPSVGGGKLDDTLATTIKVNVIAPPDSTPPGITPNVVGTLGNNDWYTSDVTVSWSVVDNESTISSSTGCGPTTINADTGGMTLTCSATSAGGPSSQSVTIKRDATQPGVSWSGGINGGETFVYGSVPAAPTCSASDGLSGPAGCVVTGYDASVGTHTLSATATDVAGNSTTETRSYTVDQATATIVVNPYNVTYDGNPHTSTGSAMGVNSEDLSGLLNLSGTTHTNAGAYTDNWSFAGNTNYKPATGTVDNNISQASSSTTVTVSDATYDGNPHGGSAMATGAGGLNESLTVNYEGRNGTIYGPSTSAPTNAGEYTASASFAGDDNHTGSSDSKDFTIFKASSATTLTCPANVTYTGSPLEPCSAIVTGAGGLNQSVDVVYANNMNAGTATATATYIGDQNHTGSSDSKNFTIDKAPSTTTVNCPASVVYNGSAQTPCFASVTGAGGLNESLTVSYLDNTNAGIATASASYAGDDNHEPSSNSTTFEIVKADATCTVTGYNVVFDNNDHTATGSCTGVLNESLSGLDLSGTTHKLVGTYSDTWTFTDVTGNYNDTSGTITDKISAWTFGGFYQPVDMGTSTSVVYNTVKNGSTVPMKFKVFAGATELTNVSVISASWSAVSCTSAAEDSIEVLATGNTSLRYDATAGQFIFNWQTPKKPGTCYKVTMTTLDGSTLSAYFKLK